MEKTMDKIIALAKARDKALLAIRQKIQRLEVRRQSLRREAATNLAGRV